MHNITTSQKVLALAFLTLVGSCAIYWFVERAIDRRSEELVEARDAHARTLFEEENMQRAQDLLTITSDTRALLESRLLPVDEPLEFLSLVDDTLPRIAGAPTEVVSISKEAGDREAKDATDQMSHVRVVLNAQGGWSNLFHLLLLLEHIPYAVSLDRVILTLSKTEGEYAWEADMLLTGGAQ